MREEPRDRPPRHRFRVEVLPPQPEVVRVTIRRRYIMPPWVMVALIFVALFVLWRFKMAFVMLAALMARSRLTPARALVKDDVTKRFLRFKTALLTV
jgi:hypothetical protein